MAAMRVCTIGQIDLDAGASKQDYAVQIDALKAAGCITIFTEKVSGKSTDGCGEFAKLRASLQGAPVLLVLLRHKLSINKVYCPRPSDSV
jgi:hypothetical protein